MASDFDDIFGDLKEDEQFSATLPSDFDDASIFGDSSASSTSYKSGENVEKPSDAPAHVVAPPPAPAASPISVSAPETNSAASSSSAKPSWEQMGGTEQDDFLSWLDDGSAPESAPTPSPPPAPMDDITLDNEVAEPAVQATPPVENTEVLSPAITVHVAAALPPTSSVSLDDDDDDDDDDFLEKIIENAKKKTSSSRESSLHIKSHSSSLSHGPGQDIDALRKSYFDTGGVPAASRLTLWRHAIHVDSKESISMYALQTTPLDLENQALLRKEIESLCGSIFSSKLYLEIVQSSGDTADGARLLFIDSAEILMTYLCKKLRMDYSSGLALTFAPLITASGNDPLRLELVETLLAVCHCVLPHLPKHVPTHTVANARRPLVKWLLLYHAPAMAIHLDQHFHTWNLGVSEHGGGSSSSSALSGNSSSAQASGALPDSWVASMFESESNHEFDFLMKVWDCCLMLNCSSSTPDALAGSHSFPSTCMCFIIVHTVMRSEKKLLRMEGDQLRHCMAQTLLDALKNGSDKLINEVQKLIEATPPSFCCKLRDVGYMQPPPSTTPSENPTETAAKANLANNLGMFSLISASTTGVKELSNMMIDMPTKLLFMGSSAKPAAASSSASKEDTNQNVRQLFQQLSEAGGAGSSIAMTLSAGEVIPQVFKSFQAPIADEKIRYFILDCRAIDELRDGQIPTAFHFDPDAVTDRQVVDQVLATLNPMKSKVHLVVMGHGYGHIAHEIRLQQEKQIQHGQAPSCGPQSPFALKEDFFEAYATDLTRVNSALLFLTKQGFPYVSVLEGGFAAAHEQLFHSTASGTVDDLIDHNAPQCSFCQHHRSMTAPGTGVPGISASPLPIGASGGGDAAGGDSKQEPSSRTTSSSSSRGSSSSTMSAQKTASGGELDAKSLFGAHANPPGGSYFSSFTGALKTGGKSFMNPADSLKDSTKWLMKKTTDPAKAEAKQAPGSADRASLTSGLPKFNKIRSSLAAMGSESLDMLKKAEQAAVAKTRLPFGASLSPASSPTVQTAGNTSTGAVSASAHGASSASGERNASFQKSEEEVFTIDDDDEEEQDDFVGGGRGGSSSRTSSSSSARSESFHGHGGDHSVAAFTLHSVDKGHVSAIKKGMRVSRAQMLPCVDSPFFSGYKKKKTDARVSMLPRRLVIAENHLVVLKAERNMDDVYLVKSCHSLSHVARMTCLKKNALMVTVYYKWKRADDGEVQEKRNSYEVQQRDEFIKAIKGAMEKIAILSQLLACPVPEIGNLEHSSASTRWSSYLATRISPRFALHTYSLETSSSAMSDKKRESMASKIDEVAKNQIWREQLKTEYIMESALTPFQLNPKTLSSITQKPTRTHPAEFGNVHEEKDTEALAAKMKEIMKKPSEKYPMPLTEAQRVGWLHEMASKGIRADMHQRMFKGRGSCDVTTFADTYCTMAGCSPFADKSTR